MCDRQRLTQCNSHVQRLQLNTWSVFCKGCHHHLCPSLAAVHRGPAATIIRTPFSVHLHCEQRVAILKLCEGGVDEPPFRPPYSTPTFKYACGHVCRHIQIIRHVAATTPMRMPGQHFDFIPLGCSVCIHVVYALAQFPFFPALLCCCLECGLRRLLA